MFSKVFNTVRETFSSLWKGMKVTMKHLFGDKVTIQYPEDKPILPDRERSRLYVNMDDCIGCLQCERACPVDCITIDTEKAVPGDEPGETSQGKKKALWVTQFDIDMGKCCFCNLCVPPCPTDCIYMTNVYEFAEYDRNSFIYNFSTLTEAEKKEKVSKAAEQEEKKKKAKK